MLSLSVFLWQRLILVYFYSSSSPHCYDSVRLVATLVRSEMESLGFTKGELYYPEEVKTYMKRFAHLKYCHSLYACKVSCIKNCVNCIGIIWRCSNLNWGKFFYKVQWILFFIVSSHLTMDKLLEGLKAKAKLDCEEAHRQLMCAINGGI